MEVEKGETFQWRCVLVTIKYYPLDLGIRDL